MCLQPRPMQAVPEETRRVAQAAFPNGNLYMRLRDELGEVYTDEQFVRLFSSRGQPAEAPGRLALVTVMQFGRTYQIDKRPRQSAPALIGNMRWGLT